MFKTTIHTLSLLKEVLQNLPEGLYAKPCNCLSGATIGQHTRHIVELYQCLLLAYETDTVNYDDRPRNTIIENNQDFALKTISEIQNTIEKPDKDLLLINNLNDECFHIRSTYFREVFYNLEHTIHHQALLRVGIEALCEINLPDTFGVAPSTTKYLKECVQ